MAYNLTLIGNSSGVLPFMQLVNTELMFGYLGVLFLIIIGGISFMSFMASTNDAGKSLATTSFILMGISLLLRAVDLVPNLALFITVTMCAASLAFAFKGR